MSALVASLRERAAQLERPGGVTREVVAELAADGLLGVYGPDAPSPAEQRRVAEDVAGASPDAWFVWFQHGPVVMSLVSTDNAALADAHLADLCAGRAQGGVAWSNLRTSRPSVTAERVDGGWLLDGPQPWCTGLPLLDLVMVGGLARESGQVVFGVLTADVLTSTGPLHLASMAGTSTHAVRYDRVLLLDERVVRVAPYDAWSAHDRAGNANVQPSTFGVALAALDLVDEPGLRDHVLEVRERAYHLLDHVERTERVPERLELRARALTLATTCALAAVTAAGGRGMGLDHPAQRLLRAAAFQVVHSQDAEVRAATLAALIGTALTGHVRVS